MCARADLTVRPGRASHPRRGLACGGVNRDAPTPSAGRPPVPFRVRDAHRRELARLGERLAASHLQRLGFELLDRNARTPAGELDLVAFDGGVIVFAEVKTRQVSGRTPVAPGSEPLAGLRAKQRLRIRRAAAAWLAERGRGRPRAREIRFDAIGVLVDGSCRLIRLEHLEAAW